MLGENFSGISLEKWSDINYLLAFLMVEVADRLEMCLMKLLQKVVIQRGVEHQ